jgi:hypothetical protein
MKTCLASLAPDAVEKVELGLERAALPSQGAGLGLADARHAQSPIGWL